MVAKIVLRNMRRNSRRTALTSATIALTTFLFAMLVSIPASMDRLIADASTTLRLIVNNRTRGYEGATPARYCREIEQIPGVIACAPFNGMMATYRDAREPFVAMAAGPELTRVFPDYDLPVRDAIACAADRRCGIAGALLARKYGWRVGQQVMLRDTGAGHMELNFVIGGITQSRRYPNNFTFSREYLEEARKASGIDDHDLAAFLIIRVAHVADMAPIARRIDETYRNSGYETRTMTESEMIAGGLSQIGNVRGIIAALCAVVVATVMLLAANAMAMMVRERITEVAVMRALGFSRISVAELLIGESLAICLLGATVGTALALWVFGAGVNAGAVLGGVGSLFVDTNDAALAMGAALLVAIGSVAIPLLGALRISPALAFRKVV
ncbi:MAG: ABC transporter permease [Candidatus Binataceae bacterium]